MSRKTRKNVGVIGLGIIGTRVAAGLRAAGYQVYVWNRTAKPAPNFLGSPAEIAESAEVIQIMVADAAALFDVIESMGEALTARHIVVCSATVGPEAVLEAARIVEATGAQFLDAPFTGSKLAAEKRQLVYYVGGAEHTFLKARPVLEATSKSIVRIGEVGHAATIKIVTNMISAVTVQVLAEALSIVQKAGLEPETLAAAIEHNACRSGVVDLKLPKMIAGDYDPHFSLKHMFKDVQLGIHMANALDIEIPTTTVTAGVMYGAMNRGWAELDFSALFKNYLHADGPDQGPGLLESGGKGSAADTAKDSAVTSADTERDDSVGGSGLGSTERAGELNAGAPSSAAGDPAPDAPSAHPKGPDTPDDASPAESAPRESFRSGAPASLDGETSKPEEAGDRIAKTSDAAAPGEEPGGNGSESPVRANNFVRRWFVARSGS